MIALIGEIKMKFILSAWLNRGIHRDIGKVDKSAITHNIAITANQRIYRYICIVA